MHVTGRSLAIQVYPPTRIGTAILLAAEGHMLRVVHDETPDRQDPRWEYRVVWRYGPLLLIILGMALFAIGLSGLCATAVSTAALPVGLILVISSAVLPRIEGKFTAGPHGITAPLLAVHELDKYTVTGPALAPIPQDVTVSGSVALPRMSVSGDGSTADAGVPATPGDDSRAPVVMGDVWAALKLKLEVPHGFRAVASRSGQAYLQAPDGRTIALPKPGLVDWRPVSSELLNLLASWDVHPVASGSYLALEDGTALIDVPWQLNPPELSVEGN
jgi:hypothetical protein